jgi:hypothetical protein
VLKIPDLKANPADQSAYYQNQTVYMLGQISQQLASIGDQISTNSSSLLPFQFNPSASDRRVNTSWLLSLVCSLFAAFLATLVQQWSQSYMHIFQQADNPLQIARFRLFLFEGSERLPVLAEVVLGLIHSSLILFFWGLGDLILQIDPTIFHKILAPIVVCMGLYLYCTIAPLWISQSPYRTPFSSLIWFLIQLLRSPLYRLFHRKGDNPTSIGKHQERSSMKETKSRMNRDVRAIRWLIDRINGSDEMQALVLAIPGSFNKKWGQKVWKGVVGDQSMLPANLQVQSHPGLSSAPENKTVRELCRRVRYFFETYKDEGNLMDTGKGHTRRMRGYVETAASLVCCTGVELGLFGEVGEVLSEVGDNEHTNDPSKIRLSPLFAVRLTCLSLVAIRKMINDKGLRLQELAKFALDGIARLHTDYGIPDTTALMAIAERIDGYLMKAWAPVFDLHVAFDSKPWSVSRTESDIIGILRNHEHSISELERIATDAGGVEEVDWYFTLILGMMDETTHKLMQRLPGVSFDKTKPPRPMISEVFDFPSVETTPTATPTTTPVPPQLIPPGRQIQSLCTIGRDLRDIMEGRNPERREDTLKSLESFRDIPVSLRGLNYLMKRQIWRLLDLRNGGGFGFTVELFFLSLRQLELSSASTSSELKEAYYVGTFEAITSDWETFKDSVGTQRILLDLLCDLVIGDRGAFSNFPYPRYIVRKLLELVEKMVKGQEGVHIDDIIHELEELTFRNLVDNDLNLRDEALQVIQPSLL